MSVTAQLQMGWRNRPNLQIILLVGLQIVICVYSGKVQQGNLQGLFLMSKDPLCMGSSQIPYDSSYTREYSSMSP